MRTRIAQQRKARAEQAPIEFQGIDAAAAQRRAIEIGVIVGRICPGVDFEARALGQVVEGAWPAAKELPDEGLGCCRPGGVAQIGEDVLRGVGMARLFGEGIERNPHGAA